MQARLWAPMLAAVGLAWSAIGWLAWSVEPWNLPAIERAEFVAASGEEPPAPEAPWRAVALPDDWRDRPSGLREAWYRIRFSRDSASGPSEAVYLPALAMNAAVYLNGEIVGSAGRFEEPISRNWNQPLLFSLPPPLLRPGENIVHVRVKADLDDSGMLGRVHVGPRRELGVAHARATFIKQTLVWVLVACRLFVASFTAAVWVFSQRASYFGWFSASAVAWVVAELNLLVVDIPVSTDAWYWLLYVAIGWWAIFSVRLIASFLDVSNPRQERAVLVLGTLGSILLGMLAILHSATFHAIAVKLWLPTAFLTSVLMFRSILPALRSHPDGIEVRVVFVVTTTVAGCVLWDLLMQIGLRPRGGLGVPPFSSAVAVLGIGWVLARRFVGILRESQQLVATLEARVLEKRAALDESYARVRDADHARVLAEERERIMREMHDGLGSHLVSTLAMVESGAGRQEAIAPAVRAALDDLRLMVDSLSPVEGDLVSALAMLRARLQPRLEAAGIAVAWNVEDLPPRRDLGPEKILQVLRILQEAFTNVIRHARARTVAVHTGISSNDGGERLLFVEVADDGSGFDDSASSGRGLVNMRRRADAIGASLTIDGSGHGTRVRLAL